jgi:hypothetical protein
VVLRSSDAIARKRLRNLDDSGEAIGDSFW